MEIVILPSAEADWFEAWERYETLAPGLGDRFDEAVRHGLKLLSQFPELAALYMGEFRRLLLRRFGYGIFYRRHDERLVIVALLDLRRNPELIQRHLETQPRTTNE